MLCLDFKRFALTILRAPPYWLLENQSGFANESRNAVVLTYNFLRSNSRDHAPFFPSYNGKGYS